jgi:hypothetical protein
MSISYQNIQPGDVSGPCAEQDHRKAFAEGWLRSVADDAKQVTLGGTYFSPRETISASIIASKCRRAGADSQFASCATWSDAIADITESFPQRCSINSRLFGDSHSMPTT